MQSSRTCHSMASTPSGFGLPPRPLPLGRVHDTPHTRTYTSLTHEHSPPGPLGHSLRPTRRSTHVHAPLDAPVLWPVFAMHPLSHSLSRVRGPRNCGSSTLLRSRTYQLTFTPHTTPLPAGANLPFLRARGFEPLLSRTSPHTTLPVHTAPRDSEFRPRG